MMSNNKARVLEQIGYNSKFHKLIESLNSFEIAYLEKEYIKENKLDKIDYKDFEDWLFDRWEDED